MGLLDQIILLLTGLTAVYLIYRLYQDYNQRKPEATYNFYYIVSFAVLFVSGVLLILAGWGMFIETDNGWDLLQAPFVAVVATLIPLCLSIGLMYEFNKKSAKGYFIFAIIALVLVIFTRTEFCEKEVVKIIVYAGTHAIAGLLIFFIPIFAIKNKQAPKGFYWVTVGGGLIGLGGIALAFLKSGAQLLFFSGEFVQMILAPLLLLMALAYTMGFMKKINSES